MVFNALRRKEALRVSVFLKLEEAFWFSVFKTRRCFMVFSAGY